MNSLAYLCGEITYKLRMKQHYYIDLIEEYSNVNFYSIHLEGEELSELERFFEKFPVGVNMMKI